MTEPAPAFLEATRNRWEASFAEQIARSAFNTAPVESVVRTVAYHLRDRYTGEEQHSLHFLEAGCGAGPNLVWLAARGIRVSGIDIAPSALSLARQSLERAGYADRIDTLQEASVSAAPFEDASFDGIIEACVFQHLAREERRRAFAEVSRLLRPRGVFVGYMLDVGHTVFRAKRDEQLADDPGSLLLSDARSKMYLTGIGLSHFFRAEEFDEFFKGFSVVDPCLTTYYLPRTEALRRGYDTYLQSMWTVYAVK